MEKKWETLKGERKFYYLLQSSRETLCFIHRDETICREFRISFMEFYFHGWNIEINLLIRHLISFKQQPLQHLDW